MKNYITLLTIVLLLPQISIAGKRPYTLPSELIRAEEVAQCKLAVDMEAASKCDTTFKSLKTSETITKRLPGCSIAVALAKAACNAGTMEVFHEVVLTPSGPRNYETLLKLPGRSYPSSILLSTYSGRAATRKAVTHCWLREPSQPSGASPLPKDYVSLTGCPTPNVFYHKWLQNVPGLGLSLAVRTFTPSFMGYVTGPRAVPPNVPVYQCKNISTNNLYLSNDKFCEGNLTLAFLGYERRHR